ncbi:hypothetical protein DENSPDRAFT_679770 [Dentipellis sp. KUC8613]|nr:hypothetical protein DENSPDRAFT_679770 [Dentipellis sp. KUC8613]
MLSPPRSLFPFSAILAYLPTDQLSLRRVEVSQLPFLPPFAFDVVFASLPCVCSLLCLCLVTAFFFLFFLARVVYTEYPDALQHRPQPSSSPNIITSHTIAHPFIIRPTPPPSLRPSSLRLSPSSPDKQKLNRNIYRICMTTGTRLCFCHCHFGTPP